jgi:RNase H-like domain found in reverse transcriptase
LKPFDVYTDASRSQLGATICQNDKQIAFYSSKLSPAQTWYTTTECELLTIVETLKEFCNILFGHKIRIFTDHQNLTYKNFNTECVMQWHLLIEDFGPEFIYIKGSSNVVTDALSRLNSTSEPMSCDHAVVEEYGATTKDIMFPITFTNILCQQQ